MQAWSEWDIPSLIAQNQYWTKSPPVHLLVAGYLGYRPPGGSSGDLQAMFSDMPALPDHLKPKIADPLGPLRHG